LLPAENASLYFSACDLHHQQVQLGDHIVIPEDKKRGKADGGGVVVEDLIGRVTEIFITVKVNFLTTALSLAPVLCALYSLFIT
jgi:hypothetical protein